ncbi:MAG: Dabb family protein [Candidatus Sumerlaeota bacterium]|nr:Dabb family protein [Candidatus Sumerlaeota bacterium]
MVKHIVIFKAKPETTEVRMGELMGELASLKSKIEGIVDFSGGKNISGEGRSHGFTHGFVMTFADQAKLQAYLPHSQHKAVAAKALALCEDVVVIDFEA